VPLSRHEKLLSFVRYKTLQLAPVLLPVPIVPGRQSNWGNHPCVDAGT
jgi:hypothetical protein